MGIDNLPSELPTDASQHFGSQLLPLLPPLLSWSGMDDKGKGLENLPAPLQRACLTSHGQLMPRWGYINRLRSPAVVTPPADDIDSAAKVQPQPVNYALKLQLVGHLFDTGLINQVFDELERHNKGPDIVFSVLTCDVRPNSANGRQLSRVIIQLAGPDRDSVNLTAEHISKIVTSHTLAEANASILSQGTTTATIIANHEKKEVVLLGAGRVALPFARLFKDRPDVKLIILSDDPAQAKPMVDLMHEHNNGEFVSYNHTVDQHTVLPSLLKRPQTAVVCSLLPATMHPAIAAQALAHNKHMVTASYVSPELQAFHGAAVSKKLIMLHEMGLDPGIDHMLCAEARDHIKAIDGGDKVKITELVSLCGGLPDPVAAALNPLRYKISWSPRGVLTAAQNSARYLQRGSIVEVAGEDLLKAASPSQRFPTLRLEVIPNRDSLRYQQLYDLPHLHSICRGTLRYEGWGSIMYSLKTLGLFDAAPLDRSRSALEVVKGMFPGGLTSTKLREHLQRCGVSNNNSNGKNNGGLDETRQALDEAVVALDWLGLTNDSREEDRFLASQHKAHTALDALSLLMESRLAFGSDERDMVAMFHRIVGEHVDSGKQFVITSRLLEFGTVGGDSAMAATVGYTAAIGAELIVNGELQRHKEMRGVLIPTDKRIYEPVLKRLRQVGINWSDTMTELDKDGNVLSHR